MQYALAPEVHEALVGWALEVWPEEACGLLLGRGTRVVAARRTRNAAKRPLLGFVIDPLETLAVAEAAAEGGLEVVGVWHSHPQGEASMSSADRRGNPFALAVVVPILRPPAS